MQMGCGYSVPFEDGFTEMETVLPAPHNLRLRKTTHGEECLCWDAPSNLVTSYYLYGHSYSSKHMDFVGEVSAKRTACYLSELPITQNIENTFGVQAIYGQNESNISYIKLNPGNRKTKSTPPLTNKTEKDFSASDNNPPDSDKDMPRSVYVSTYQHDFGKHCDMQGYLPPLDSKNKIRHLNGKDNETEKPGDRKTKSKPPVTSKTDKDVIASKNDPSDSDKDTPEKATYVSTYHHEFGSHCDMGGCSIPLTDDSAVLTLQCQHKICYDCYDKVLPFLQQNKIFQTYEIKCMVCGVYSSVEIYQDDKNNIIYLQCKETNAEKTMKADLVHSKLKGIPNIGSTCYANCILQVLGQTPNLVSSLQSLMEQFSNIKKLPISSMLLMILQKFECDDGMYVDTRLIQELITEIHSIDQSFERFRQNDCHSFLICLFNGIQDEIISAHGELKKKTFKNPLEMFEGKMYNNFEYLPCNHSEQSEDQVFTSLLIPIQENRTNGQQEQWSIEKGLRLMMGSEEFDGEILPCLTCENTGATSLGKKITTKTFGISEPPAILILQLGRFREVRGRLRKVDCDITYETSLDIEVINNRTQIPACLKYELYSVVLHYGSIESGHYYSYVKSITSGQWFTCSDRYVRKVQDPFEWGFSEAYLLFYQRLNY